MLTIRLLKFHLVLDDLGILWLTILSKTATLCGEFEKKLVTSDKFEKKIRTSRF